MAPTRPRALPPALFALLAWATLAPAAARAGTLHELEAALRRVAAEAGDKTVAIRVTMAGGGEGFGSGALVSPDGLVLTCAHVTEPAAGGALTAIFPDGTQTPLTVVASNARNDLALCRLAGERTDFPHFLLAPADPSLGDWVVALGHPGGPFPDRRPTVSAGKVTGVGRALPMPLAGKAYVGALQTDVPLFGGNSGGPLVDLQGRLVGINGAILLVGDASFASGVGTIAADLPALREGRDVPGREITDLFGAMTAMAGELDPAEMAEAFADESMRGLFNALGPMMAAQAASSGPKARRRDDDVRAALSPLPVRAAAVLADGRPFALATRVGRRAGRALFLTSGSVREAAGALSVAEASPPGADARPGVARAARLRGVDGRYDLALLDVAEPGDDLGLPRLAAPGDAGVGSFVVLAGDDGAPRRSGIVAAVDRSVGTERKIPTLGVVRLFQPPHTSPFRPYPPILQVDLPLEADERGAPVLRPDGALVGVAVAHFHRAATFVVPAAVLGERVERLLAGLDDPAPPTYGPPPRPAPDRAARAARAAQRTREAAPTLTLYAPTLSGVRKPLRFVEADPSDGAEGLWSAADAGGGAHDVRAGDRLVRVGGRTVRSVQDATEALDALEVGVEVALTVRRGAEDLLFRGAVETTSRGRRFVLR